MLRDPWGHRLLRSETNKYRKTHPKINNEPGHEEPKWLAVQAVKTVSSVQWQHQSEESLLRPHRWSATPVILTDSRKFGTIKKQEGSRNRQLQALHVIESKPWILSAKGRCQRPCMPPCNQGVQVRELGKSYGSQIVSIQEHSPGKSIYIFEMKRENHNLWFIECHLSPHSVDRGIQPSEECLPHKATWERSPLHWSNL